ncbi:NAD+ synthase [Hahella sp. CCB-MM4]|uniref:NAD+ synthase n=1 Tax=Hahella sp. (strain CCB-MM4) TaxID=1926491 RepID=UPI000B9BDBE9|nr:NAD+ synthase [Hahella sp. CCB-MM4]OZG71483.1 NAD+ synthase [Hahella sp. CCB-MM4]
MSKPVTETSEPIVVFAQIDCLVGDIPGNADKVIKAVRRAREEHQADLVIFPELTLSGYPPEDLLLRPSLQTRVEKALNLVLSETRDATLVLGLPWREGGKLRNAAVFIENGEVKAWYFKRCLPNYQVFDEKRYFEPGQDACVVEWRGYKVGLTVCEDIWENEPAADTAALGADFLVNINASPFHMEKQRQRKTLVQSRARDNKLPILYVNLLGGQDELIFDGGSFAVNEQGHITFCAPQYESGLYPIALNQIFSGPEVASDCIDLPIEESIYKALVLAVRDYVNKNGFKSVVLGLSGGIDSAVTLAVAVDALGVDRVRAVMMPFRYTSQISLDDAEEEASRLGVQYDVVSIEPMYDAYMAALNPLFEGYSRDTTEENIQARIRGVILMSISNKTGALVLTTGNKSEMAVGYATLYGDMAGGYDVLKDVFKTMVFRLARYRNSLSYVIPERVIVRPPSAELAPDQVDEDSLPPYDILDQMLSLYVEQDVSAEGIVSQGFDREATYKVTRLVDVNEYKRRQAPVGPRITARGFGRDRRYPITSGWKLGE